MHYTNKLLRTVVEGRLATAKNKPLQKIFNQKNDTFNPVSYDADNKITYYSRGAVIKLINRSLAHGRPVFVAGVPGVSKSVSMEQIARQRATLMGRQYKHWGEFSLEERKRLVQPEAGAERAKYYIMMDVRTNLMAKEDATGIPDVMNNLEYTKYRPQIWLYYVTLGNSAGMVFFDEMNQGADEVLKSLMQTFLDKRIGDHQFNTRNGVWDITSAGNAGAEYNNTEIPIALRQRADIYGMSMTSREWTAYAKSAGINDAIISFVNSGFKRQAGGGETNPYLIAPPETELDGGVSPRSIEFFSRQYDDMIQNDDVSEKEIEAKAAGTLTKTWAEDFITYLKSSQIFNFEKYQVDSDMYANTPEKYMQKYGISDNDVKKVASQSKAVAHDLSERYFTTDGKKQVSLMFLVMRELFDELTLQLNDYEIDTKLDPEQRNAVKVFVEFINLMRESGNEEVTAILVNMFLTGEDGQFSASGMETITKILSTLNEKNALATYKSMFKKSFQTGRRLKDGELDKIEMD